MLRTLAAVLVAALLGGGRAHPLLAQRPEEWRINWIAYPAYNTLERVSLNAVVARRRTPRPGPPPLTASMELQGRISTSGTRGITALFDAPGYWPRWRLLVMGSAERTTRAPYYGLGNTSLDDSAEAANGDVFFYRYKLVRTTLVAAAQRSLGGPVRALAGLQWRHYRARPLAGGATRLGEDITAGVVGDTGSTDNLEVRAGLLLDTRDEEGSPSRGVFLEAVGAHGLGTLGAEFSNYSRWMFGARGFLPLGEQTTLAGRAQYEFANGAIPFFVMYERLTSWRPEDGFGGSLTLRANLPGRWLAPNRALTSVDLRYKRIDIPFPRSPVRLWLLAFADAGVVWLDGQRPSTHNLQGGAGVGVRAQYSKSGMFGIDLGYSRDSKLEFATAFQFAY